MRLTKFWDIDSEVLWFSPLYTESDKPLRFAVKLEYTEEWGDDAVQELGKYHVSIAAVGPDWISDKELQRAVDSSGNGETLEQFRKLPHKAQCQVLLQYGTAATLWQKSGNNKGELLKEVRKELRSISVLFGFYMDKPLNMIGSTGWDFISGDILAGLKATV